MCKPGTPEVCAREKLLTNHMVNYKMAAVYRPVQLEGSLRERSRRRPAVRDKEAAVAAILAAAEAEFARYGLQGARVDAIARAAGVTKGLIFHYFANKEHLFEDVLRRASAPLKAVLAELESSPAAPPELLRALVTRFLQEVAARPLAHLLFTLESIQNNGEHYRKLGIPSLCGALERVLARGVRQGSFRKLDTRHAAINIVGLCMYYFCSASIHPDPELQKDPCEMARLARHAKEVMRFVEAATAPVKA